MVHELLDYAIDYGRNLKSDLTEVRYEDMVMHTLTLENGSFRDAVLTRQRGVAITAYTGSSAGFSYTSLLTKQDIKSACRRAWRMSVMSRSTGGHNGRIRSMRPIVAKGVRPPVKEHPKSRTIDEKKDILMEVYRAAREEGERISSLVVRYAEVYGTKTVVNSEGTDVTWEPLVVDLQCTVVSKGMGGDLVDGSDGAGGTFGFERFRKDEYSPETIGKNSASWAKEKLRSRPAPAGEFRCVCEHLLSGVLAHESFGHLTEGDFILSNSSPLTGRLGEHLGSEHATIIDEGCMDPKRYNVYWMPFDDQGVRCGKTTLLENGVLKGYLHTRVTSSLLAVMPTGNARSISFYFPVIPRMTNTYFKPGDMGDDEIIRELKTGIYAIRTQGGQVNTDGTFMFKAARGYWVEKGEIKYPLRDVILMGDILTLLKRIEGATKKVQMESGYFGGCGKVNQSPLPVGDGGPEVLISGVRFGGEVR